MYSKQYFLFCFSRAIFVSSSAECFLSSNNPAAVVQFLLYCGGRSFKGVKGSLSIFPESLTKDIFFSLVSMALEIGKSTGVDYRCTIPVMKGGANSLMNTLDFFSA